MKILFLSFALAVLGCSSVGSSPTETTAVVESSVQETSTAGCLATCNRSCQGQYQACVSNCSACVPVCVNRQCGNDGCGGSCGICAPGESCDANGRCIATGGGGSGGSGGGGGSYQDCLNGCFDERAQCRDNCSCTCNPHAGHCAQ
jgi:hypothetical protein